MPGEYENDYNVLELDIGSAAFVGKVATEIVQNGKPIGAVTILQLPVGAVGHVFIRFGPRGDRIILRQEALTFGRNPARTNGLYLDVDAGQAGTLILLIGVDVQQVQA
jgi:hypothetical protein